MERFAGTVVEVEVKKGKSVCVLTVSLRSLCAGRSRETGCPRTLSPAPVPPLQITLSHTWNINELEKLLS